MQRGSAFLGPVAFVVGIGVICLALYFLEGYLVRGCSPPGRDRVYGDFKTFEAALLKFEISAGRFPTTQEGFDALVTRPAGVERWHQLIDSWPLDPWRQPYGYRFPGRKNKTRPELISKGPDMVAGTEDDISSEDP